MRSLSRTLLSWRTFRTACRPKRPIISFSIFRLHDLGGLKASITHDAPGASLVDAPMLRGRIVAMKGTPVEDLKLPADVQWVLNGDRG